MTSTPPPSTSRRTASPSARPRSASQARETRAADAPEARAAAAQAAAVGNEDEVGQWSGVQNWPVVAIHTALLTNGKVLAYDSIDDEPSESHEVHDRTRGTVWDPATGTQTPANVTTGYNVFCSGLAHLPRRFDLPRGRQQGRAAERDQGDARLRPERQPLDPGAGDAARALVPVGYAARQRRDADHRRCGAAGPGSDRPTGGAHHLGRAEDAERRDSQSVGPAALSVDGPGAGRPGDLHRPEQRAAGAGHARRGQLGEPGARDGIDRNYGSRASTTSGRSSSPAAATRPPPAPAWSTSTVRPQVTATGRWPTRRRQHNAHRARRRHGPRDRRALLGADLVDMQAGVYEAELWNPRTGVWSTMALDRSPASTTRRPFCCPTAACCRPGAGSAAPVRTPAYLAKNAQVFSPPYLFKRRLGTARAAAGDHARPPARSTTERQLQISTPNAGSIRRSR